MRTLLQSGQLSSNIFLTVAKVHVIPAPEARKDSTRSSSGKRGKLSLKSTGLHQKLVLGGVTGKGQSSRERTGPSRRGVGPADLLPQRRDPRSERPVRSETFGPDSHGLPRPCRESDRVAWRRGGLRAGGAVRSGVSHGRRRRGPFSAPLPFYGPIRGLSKHSVDLKFLGECLPKIIRRCS